MIFTTIEKLFVLFLLVIVGMLLKKLRFISDQGENDLSRLVLYVFWPALIFSSITHSLSAADIAGNILLPILAFFSCLVGFGLGFLFTHIFHFSIDAKKMFIYHAMINNFVFLVLPFAEILLPERGVGLLFIHNLGILLVIWTLGIFVLQGHVSVKESVRNLFAPGLVVTILAIFMVLCGWAKYIPASIQQAVSLLGQPTIPIAMLIVGTQIYKLGRQALRFDFWNISVAIMRLVLIPGLLLAFSLFLKTTWGISQETFLIFNLVNIMPVSVNSVSFAVKFNLDTTPAAQGVVFTHLFSIITIPLFILLFQIF
jgi:hypothetical protein